MTGPDGTDVISGGAGDDALTGGGGRDLLTGDGGADAIDARDGEVDRVACGAGVDSAQVDRTPADKVDVGCEAVGSGSSAQRRLEASDDQDAALSAVQDIRAASAGQRSADTLLDLRAAVDELAARIDA